MTKTEFENLRMILDAKAEWADSMARDGRAVDYMQGFETGLKYAKNLLVEAMERQSVKAESDPTYVTPEGFITWD